jgi:argonaute-like protein implicated in RNA metabolism and viral defense
MEKEQLAFHRLRPELLTLYAGQYVAIYQGKVIDHDNDKLALVARIDEKYPSQVILVKLVTSEPDKIIYARSPRLLK